MSKNAKSLSMSHQPHSRWIAEADIDWAIWEARIAEELQVENFQFSKIQRIGIGDAIYLIERCQFPVVKIEEAKIIISNIKLKLTSMNLPDCHILHPGTLWKPSEFLMSLGFSVVTDIFIEAMVHTFDEARDGKNVVQRLAVYLARLRKGECVLAAPRAEAMAAHTIKVIFEECGVSAKVGHTRPTAAGEGKEKISVFEAFIFSHIMPDRESDPAGRKALARRLDEADRATSH